MSFSAFFTDARDGHARTPRRLAQILRQRKFPAKAASAEQIHGPHVGQIEKLGRAKQYLRLDGLLTDAPQQPLAIFTADCVPLFLTADNDRVVGLLHAGWRGVRHGILTHAVRHLRRTWGIKPSCVQVWPGPHIRPCCYVVQWDVARHFPATRRRGNPGWTIDLAGELAIQARRLGVRWTRKMAFEGCTMHESRFHSYRRNQTAKRQVSVIMKRDIP